MTATPRAETARADSQRAALSRELSEFLIEFSIGVHRFSMYPSNHPSLRPIVESIIVHLADLLTPGTPMSIGVANRQLIIEGVSTDRKHPVLSDLARRLHEQQIGAISIAHGVRATGIEGLLGTLAAAGQEDGEPLGLMGDDIPSWPHIQLHPIGFDRLRMVEGEGTAPSGPGAGELWIGLARAALAGGGGRNAAAPDVQDFDPRMLAEEISGRPRDAAYDQVISGYLRQLAGELKGAQGEEAEAIRRRVTTLIQQMDEGALERLVDLGGDVQARREFVLDTNQSLAVDAVMKIVRAAASASGQEISTSMTRLLTKLSAHADSGPVKVRTQANTALRENVEELLDQWELTDPNPDQYTRVLDSMAQASPLFSRGPGMQAGLEGEGLREDELPGCVRIIRMALEVDAWGETVRAAMLDAIALGRTGELLALVEETEEGNACARRIRQHVTDPEQVKEMLAGEEIAEDALRSLVEEMGHEQAVTPLLEGLASAESRSVRRVVFDTLVWMGDVVGEAAAEGLRGDEPWFVQRNLIALLAKLPKIPANVDVMQFLSSREARVRREALPLAFRVPAARDRALGLGLADSDERVCRMALHEIRSGIPQAILPTFLNRVVKGDRSEDIRSVAIRALSGNRSKLVRDTLVEVAMDGKTLLGKPKLAEGTPAVAAALALLASEWMDDSVAASLVESARKSKEVLHRRAVESVRPSA